MPGTVTLRSGIEASEPLVRITMATLGHFMEKSPVSFYEFVMLCRDREHVAWGNCAKDFPEGFMEPITQGSVPASPGPYDPVGRVNHCIREIVRDAVEGDELEMRLVDPCRPGEGAGD
jgi:hypothetical protein